MKKAFLVAFISICTFVVKAQQTIINDPNVVLRSVGSFTAIEVSGAVDVYISQSDNETLAVSAKEIADRDRIKTVVEKGVLKIWYDNQEKKWSKGDKKLTIYVAVKKLVSIKSTGASDVYVKGKLTGDLLQLEFSGASDFKGDVSYKKLKVQLTGASDAYFKGDTQLLEINAEGASDFKGYELQTEKCIVSASGASSVKITINSELNISASGASSVYYKGKGVLKNISSSGASSVEKKD